MPLPAPTTADVAAHLRVYTHDRNANPQDDFDETTPIRASEVDKHIAGIVTDIGDVPDELLDQAVAVAALGAASESVIDKDRELSADLWARYEQRLARLRTEISKAVTGHGRSVPATGNFPLPYGAAVRRDETLRRW